MRKPVFISLVCTFILLAAPQGAHAARLWSSGAELQGLTAGGNPIHELEVSTAGVDFPTFSTTTKRSGLASFQVNTFADPGIFYHKFAPTPSSEAFYVRAYVRIATLPNSDAKGLIGWFGLVDVDEESWIRLNANGTLSLLNDTDSVIASYNTPLSLNTWYRLEYLYDQGGSVEVRLDGTQIMQVLSHDGDAVNEVFFGTDDSRTMNVYYDDIALNDTTGSAQTSWPGSGRIVHLRPNAAGDNSGCNAGGWRNVSEVTPSSLSTLNSTNVCTLITDGGGDILDVGVVSSFGGGILPESSVTLVQVGIHESASSAGAESWQLRVKSASGGTVLSGTVIQHDDTSFWTNGDPDTEMTPGNYTLTSYTDPTTGVSWTPTGTNSLDNMQIGVISVDANPDIRVDTLWVLVEYTDPAACDPSITTCTDYFARGPLNTVNDNGYGLWTVPSNVTQADVACWGGGGGGGDGTNAGAGGGGGGAFASSTLSSLVAGTQYTIFIGAGGAGATSAAGTGSDGGDSSFATTTVVADGGLGGPGASSADSSGGAGGTTANSTGTVKSAGGAGGGGMNTNDTGGGGGGAGGPHGAGGTGTDGNSPTNGDGGNGGAGSNSSGGAGGAGGTGNSSGGPGDGHLYGGGGGGGGDNESSPNGAGGEGGFPGGGGGGGESNNSGSDVLAAGGGASGMCTVTYAAAALTTPTRKLFIGNGFLKVIGGRLKIF